MKYHINKNGKPAVCKAAERPCPLGGDEVHFSTMKEARAHADKMHADEFTLLPKEIDSYSLESVKGMFPELTEEQVHTLHDYLKEEEAIKLEVQLLDKAASDTKGTDGYFDAVQVIRKRALEKYKQRKHVETFVNKDKLEEVLAVKFPEKAPWKGSSNYNFHPEISHKNFNFGVGNFISAYTGKPLGQVRGEIKEMRGLAGIPGRMSLHEGTIAYWNNQSVRTDKPIISLDLETANPLDTGSLYDNGQLTYIIEFGAIKTYPDGRVERKDFLSGVPVEFADAHGTGYVDTHNISVDMVEGKPEFTHESTQKEIMEFLDGSVVMAHNAYFERKQLTNSLRGFRDAVNKGNIEMMDTMQFCKFMVPEAERNSNEAFVEAAGLEYTGAHRAYNDAEMTLNAFNVLRKR